MSEVNPPKAQHPRTLGHIAEIGVDDLAGKDFVAGADDLDQHP
jgi:hypothetical protein